MELLITTIFDIIKINGCSVLSILMSVLTATAYVYLFKSEINASSTGSFGALLDFSLSTIIVFILALLLWNTVIFKFFLL